MCIFGVVLIAQQVVNHKITCQIIPASLRLLSLTVMQVRSARIARLHTTMPVITSSSELSAREFALHVAKSNACKTKVLHDQIAPKIMSPQRH